MNAVRSLWEREIIRFVRQRSRVIGALVQPIVFWIVIGGGLSGSFRPAGVSGGTGYLEYFFPGVLALVLLFTAIFATIAVVEDRRSGFLQGVLVAPVSRAAIVLGQALGATTIAVAQGALFLSLAPAAGVSLGAGNVVATLAAMALVAFGLTSLGLAIAWRAESTQGFHAVMNLVLMPIWLLSGAFFPAADLPPGLLWVMRLDPLTYGVAILRRCLYPEGAAVLAGLPSMTVGVVATAVFAALTFGLAVAVARRSSTLG